MPFQHPIHWKNKRIWWFWAPFRIFRIFRFFLFSVFFRSIFSVFSGVLNFRIFRFLGGRVSEETVPQPRVYFPTPVPSQTQSHSPKTAKRSGKCNHAINCCCWFPPKLSINADTDVLCVSAEAKGRRGQRTEALRATQHAGQAWTAMKGF